LLYKTTGHFLKHFGINDVSELPRPREIEEILRDDDMAEHRRLLMERQLDLNTDDADKIMDEFLHKEGSDNDEIKDKNETGPDERPAPDEPESP